MKTRIPILLIISLVAATADCDARRRATTRRNVSVRSASGPAATPAVDTIIGPDSSAIRLYGYDKPLRSNRETVFITNSGDRDINSVSITTQYLDTKGREFHEVKRRVYVEIPAGSTRKVDYPSWDRQQSFYYVGSKRPRTSGTPYDVRQSVDTVFAAPLSGIGAEINKRDCGSVAPPAAADN